ncbi:MAG: PP0621 family protein [Caldimonas sp.]
MAKLLLFLAAVFVLLWLLRGALGRRGGVRGAPAPAKEPQTIVACAHCGLHLPRDEALPGRGGVFCGDAHRAAFERERTPSP